MSILDAITNLAKKSSPVAPQGSEAAGLKAKKENIDEYNKAVSAQPAAPKAPAAGSNVDKVNKNGKGFGSRPGEKRPGPDGLPMMESYAKGTPYVPKDQVAKIHKGEAIIPAKDNPMKELFDKIPGRKEEKPPKKEIKHIITSKTHDGKFLHKHVHHNPAHEDETHVSNSMADVHSHMEDHMGMPNEGEETPASGVAPMTASPSPVAPAAPGM